MGGFLELSSGGWEQRAQGCGVGEQGTGVTASENRVSAGVTKRF